VNLYDIADRSLELLDRFLEDTYSKSFKEEDCRLAFIYRHTRNIWDLGNDCLFLHRNGRMSAAFILVRPLLESLFNLCAAVNNVGFAVEKLLHEIDHDIRKLAKWREFDNNLVMDDSMAMLSAKREEIRKQYSITQIKNWNTFETAKEARLDQQYVQDYFMFSRHTHSSTGGIIVQEHEANQQLILEKLVFIVLAGLGHAAQVLPSSSPQKNIDTVTTLLEESVKVIESKGIQRTKDGEP